MTRDDPEPIVCSCGFRLGERRRIWKRFEVRPPVIRDSGLVEDEYKELVHIGWVIELVPGFVAASTRHPRTDAPWYVRRSDPKRPSPRPTRNSVVTCKCGKDQALWALGSIFDRRPDATWPASRIVDWALEERADHAYDDDGPEWAVDDMEP